MIIDESSYNRIYSELRSYRDIERLYRKYNNLSKEFFLVIYTQKMIRMVTQKFHRVKSSAPKMTKQWKGGKSFLDISDELSFPPVMTAFIILTGQGTGKKSFRKMLMDTSLIKDERMRRELIEVNENDPIYSPMGDRVQRERGERGEERIKAWLDSHGITYEREEDLRAAGSKTPDFLLKSPIFFRGESIKWIESKASFGDLKEINKNLSKQISPYLELFGPGMVIYWFGVVNTAPVLDGIVIETDGVLEDHWDL